MVLAGSALGDGGIDMVLDNGARVFVEAYSPDLHGVLGDGHMAKDADGRWLLRQGNEVVCIGTM